MPESGKKKLCRPARVGLWLSMAVLATVVVVCANSATGARQGLVIALFPAFVSALMLAGAWIERPRTGRSAALAFAKLCVVVSSLWFAFMLGLYGVSKWVEWSPHSARRSVCHEVMTRLVAALGQYSVEADGRFPAANGWNEALRPVLRSQGVDPGHIWCPNAFSEPRDGEWRDASYAFNRSLDALSVEAIRRAEQTVVVFESDTGTGWDAAGGPELLPTEPRHLGGDNYGFADGHVAWLARKKLGTDEDGNRIWAKEPDADWVIWEPVLKESEGEQPPSADP